MNAVSAEIVRLIAMGIEKPERGGRRFQGLVDQVRGEPGVTCFGFNAGAVIAQQGQGAVVMDLHPQSAQQVAGFSDDTVRQIIGQKAQHWSHDFLWDFFVTALSLHQSREAGIMARRDSNTYSTDRFEEG